jgi:hypothetical protein
MSVSGSRLNRQPGRRCGSYRWWLRIAVACCLVCAAGVLVATADSFLDTWKLNPEYKSKYLNDRLKEDWRQSFGIHRKTGLSELTSLLNTKSIVSDRQNENTGKFMLILDRGSFLGDFKLDTNLTRRKTFKTGFLKIQDEDDIGLGAVRNYGVPDVKAIKLDLLASVLRGEEREERTRSTSSTTDRTNSTGFGGRVKLDGVWKLTSATYVSTKLSYDTSTEDSRTVSVSENSSGREEEIQNNTDRNRSTNMTLEGGWEEFKFLMVGVKGTYASSTNQYFYPQADAQETKEMLRASGNIFVGGEFSENFGYEFGMSTSENSNDYKLKDTSNQVDTDTGSDFSAFYISSLPLINGTRFDGGYTTSMKRKDSRNTNQDTKNQRIAGTAVKALNENLKLTFQISETLVQSMNDEAVNDKDTHSTSFSLTGRYVKKDKLAGTAFTATGYYKVDSKDLIYTSDNKANDSYQKDDYIVRGDYTWQRANGAQLTQKLSVNSTYDVYTFNEGKNSLNRRNKLTTKYTHPLTLKTTMMMVHRFERSDNGSYSQSLLGGGRKYRLASRTLLQGITASVAHRFNRILRFTLNEQYTITRKTAIATDVTNRGDVIWVSGVLDITLPLMEDILLVCSIEKKKGSKDQYNYWMVKADLTKGF